MSKKTRQTSNEKFSEELGSSNDTGFDRNISHILKIDKNTKVTVI